MTNELYEKLNVYSDAFQHIREFLNEKERRLFLAKTAIQFGYGAGMVLSKRTGVSYSTIRRGVKELLTGETAEEGRIRRSGAGRKAVEEIYPDIIGVTKEILDDETYGSPEGGKWRSRSLRNIARELAERGIVIEKSTAQRIVRELGYNRQQNRKMEQVGEAVPDRDEQFEFIRSQKDEAMQEGAPVISVDTKKKENLGNFKNAGTEPRLRP